jgi:hypothetical protein
MMRWLYRLVCYVRNQHDWGPEGRYENCQRCGSPRVDA